MVITKLLYNLLPSAVFTVEKKRSQKKTVTQTDRHTHTKKRKKKNIFYTHFAGFSGLPRK